MSSGEFITSCTAMLSAIVLVIYLSGKIFKAGILNYGSSVGWKEILNWAKN
jgi:ABC-2 type transport system permease protein